LGVGAVLDLLEQPGEVGGARLVAAAEAEAAEARVELEAEADGAADAGEGRGGGVELAEAGPVLAAALVDEGGEAQQRGRVDADAEVAALARLAGEAEAGVGREAGLAAGLEAAADVGDTVSAAASELVSENSRSVPELPSRRTS